MARFKSSSWKLVAFRDKRSVESEFLSLQLFPILVMLSLTVASALSLIMIRRRMKPLGQLLSATNRLAGRDFSKPVDVNSGDEFEQLGASFNDMAKQLGQQFDRLSTFSELDHRILQSGRSIDEVSQWTLQQAAALMDFRFGLLLSKQSANHYDGEVVDGKGRSMGAQRLSVASVPSSLWNSSSCRAVELPVTSCPVDAWRSIAYSTEAKHLIVMAINRNEETLGLMVVGFSDGKTAQASMTLLAEFRSRIAVAFIEPQA